MESTPETTGGLGACARGACGSQGRPSPSKRIPLWNASVLCSPESLVVLSTLCPQTSSEFCLLKRKNAHQHFTSRVHSHHGGHGLTPQLPAGLPHKHSWRAVCREVCRVRHHPLGLLMPHRVARVTQQRPDRTGTWPENEAKEKALLSKTCSQTIPEEILESRAGDPVAARVQEVGLILERTHMSLKLLHWSCEGPTSDLSCRRRRTLRPGPHVGQQCPSLRTRSVKRHSALRELKCQVWMRIVDKRYFF